MRELVIAAVGAVALIVVGVWAASATSGANAGQSPTGSAEWRRTADER